MRRKDDSSLSSKQHDRIRREAQKALESADAVGRFPTPVGEIMEMASVVQASECISDESLVKKLRRRFVRRAEIASNVLKRALSKVLGVLDIKAKLIYIDQTLHVVKQRFIKLHEVGHIVLPWQRDIYAVVEDCKKTLDPQIADEFDREANAFASEVLFQLGTFAAEAADCPIKIVTSITLSKKYGASVYATLRRFVSTNHRTCAVLVFNMPEIKSEVGFVATLRRVVESQSFMENFGQMEWPTEVTPDDDLGAMMPLNKRFSRPRQIVLSDSNGSRHECVAEAFTNTYQVFILIHDASSLSRRTFIIH